MNNEPMKISKKSPIPLPISYMTLCPPEPNVITMLYITIAIASLKIDSPKIIAFRCTSASISLKHAKTETGSVAEMSAPNAKDSYHVNSFEIFAYPQSQNIIDEKNIAIKVPRNE